ncbi:MAG: hypothetical protein ACR2M0_08490 [Chloroflexia bacterium]
MKLDTVEQETETPVTPEAQPLEPPPNPISDEVSAAHEKGAAAFADLEKAAVDALLGLASRHLPAEVIALVKGVTLAEVKAALDDAERLYSDVRTAVLREQASALPQAHSGPGAPPLPGTPFEMIRAGVTKK